MSSKRTQLKVGVFSTISLVLLVSGIVLLAGGTFFRDKEDYVLHFEGSVAGLNVGAPVVFRGVPLGKVLSIALETDNKNKSFTIPVGINLFDDNVRRFGAYGNMPEAARDEMIRRMVERGLRARVATASFLTGLARIELDFFPESPSRYHSADPSKEIPTLSSPLEEFSRALARINIDKIAHSLLQALDNFNSVMTGEEFQGALTGISRLVDEFSTVAREMPALVENARKALQRIETMADSTAQAVPRISHDMSLALDGFTRVAERAEKLFFNASLLASPNSATVRDLHSTVKELAEAARAVRSLAKSLERNPESLIRGKGRREP